MRNVIVGTAGHIDHGKTCLIQALTGIDTDRLKEEKQRGITIELGFADMPNDRGIDIGIIDVPGHERFIRHMLAGIGGIDLVLLVVAADEGFMPQTVEHFEIIKMLGIRKGIVVITKIDMVDEEWLEIVREDVSDQVAGSFLEGAPVIEVSSRTGDGIEDLRKCILNLAEQCPRRFEDPERLRLPIDRVFTIAGFGTVVTGTLMEGSVRLGDEVMLYPSEKRLKVRNLQIHGKDEKQAFAGQRTAMNLTGAPKEEIHRGDIIAREGLLQTTYMLDVGIEMFNQTKRTLKTGSRMHFFCGSTEKLCKVVLLDAETLTEGQKGFAQLRFNEPVAVRYGDRFILRFYSPMETIGGGTILDAEAKKKKRYDESVLEGMRQRSTGEIRTVLEEMFLQEGRRLTNMDEILSKSAFAKEEALETTQQLLQDKVLLQVSESLVLHSEYMEEIQEKVGQFMEEYHRKNPLSNGMRKEEFRRNLMRVLRTEDLKKTEQILDKLRLEGIIQEQVGTIALQDFTVEYTEEQRKIEEQIVKQYLEADVESPATESVEGEYKNKELIRQIIANLVFRGVLVRTSSGYLMHKEAFDKCMHLLSGILQEKGKVTLGEFRDSLGTSRKYAELFLNYTDAAGVTKMVGDHRISAQ